MLNEPKNLNYKLRSIERIEVRCGMRRPLTALWTQDEIKRVIMHLSSHLPRSTRLAMSIIIACLVTIALSLHVLVVSLSQSNHNFASCTFRPITAVLCPESQPPTQPASHEACSKFQHLVKQNEKRNKSGMSTISLFDFRFLLVCSTQCPLRKKNKRTFLCRFLVKVIHMILQSVG